MNDNVASDELNVARKLVSKALELGCIVSVHDGEEWPLKRCASLETILEALGSTDTDTLLLRNADTDERIGSIWLVWGNGGNDLIADNSDNYQTNKLVANFM